MNEIYLGIAQYGMWTGSAKGTNGGKTTGTSWRKRTAKAT